MVGGGLVVDWGVRGGRFVSVRVADSIGVWVWAVGLVLVCVGWMGTSNSSSPVISCGFAGSP